MAHLFVWIRSNWSSSTFALQHAAVYGPKLGPKCFLLGCLCSLWPPAYLTRGTISLCCFCQLLLALVRSRRFDTKYPELLGLPPPRGVCTLLSASLVAIYIPSSPQRASICQFISICYHLSYSTVYRLHLSENNLCLGYRFRIRSSPQQTVLFGLGHHVIFLSLLWLLVGTQRDQKRGNPAMCNHSGPHDTGNTKSICESHNEDATLHILQREDGWGLC